MNALRVEMIAGYESGYQKGKEKEAAMWTATAKNLRSAADRCDERAVVCQAQASVTVCVPKPVALVPAKMCVPVAVDIG